MKIQGIVVQTHRHHTIRFGEIPEKSNPKFCSQLTNEKGDQITIYFSQQFYENLAHDIRHDVLNLLNFIYAHNSMIEESEDIDEMKDRITQIQDHIDNKVEEHRNTITSERFVEDK